MRVTKARSGPSEESKLLSLPSVGQYCADAVGCLAYAYVYVNCTKLNVNPIVGKVRYLVFACLLSFLIVIGVKPNLS